MVSNKDPLSGLSLNSWTFIAILAETVILLYCYEQFTEAGEVFRHAARFSGRLSLLMYLFCFYYFANGYQQNNKPLQGTRKLVIIFCILHFIHLLFLAFNIYLNNIPLVPVKLAGGFLAYLMVLIYPFIIEKVGQKRAVHLFYFYYVGLVMALTYVARIKGDFEGAVPSVYHYIGLMLVLLCFIMCTAWMFFRLKKTHNYKRV